MSRNVLSPKPLKLAEISPEVAEHQGAIAAGIEREYWLSKGYHPDDVDWLLKHNAAQNKEQNMDQKAIKGLLG